MLFTGIYKSLIVCFFYYLEIAEDVKETNVMVKENREDAKETKVMVKETKDMVNEIHKVLKRSDNCQSASMATGEATRDIIGRIYFSLLL